MDMNQYKILSVHSNDYNTIKDWAYYSPYSEMEIVSYLVEHYKHKLLSEKEEQLDSIYFASDEHKALFKKYLKIDQFSNYKNDILICFYINSFLGIYVKDLENLLSWIGQWNEEHTEFKDSIKYKKIEKDKRRLVDFANMLLYETDPLCILKAFSLIENEYVVLAQEMLRLKLLKL